MKTLEINNVKAVKDFHSKILFTMNYFVIPGLNVAFGVTVADMITPESLEEKQNAIAKAVCSHYEVGFKDLLLKSRKRSIVVPRQVIMYLLHKMLGIGCVDVGKLFNFDHTTAMHSFKLIQDLIDSDEKFRNEIRNIKENIF